MYIHTHPHALHMCVYTHTHIVVKSINAAVFTARPYSSLQEFPFFISPEVNNDLVSSSALFSLYVLLIAASPSDSCQRSSLQGQSHQV